MSRTVQDIVEIGRDLIAVKDRVERGSFLPWIEAEFEMGLRAAQRMISAATKYDNVAYLNPAALYELAAPSTPEEVRTEIAERVLTRKRVCDSHPKVLHL